MHLRHWMLAAAALLLAGCAALPGQGSSKPINTYLLAPPLAAAKAPAAARPVLQVMPPAAAAGYGDRRMAYSRQTYELSYFARSQWADAPTQMLEPLLVQALERSGHYRAVVGPAAGVNADLRLDTELLALRQLFPESTATDESEGAAASAGGSRVELVLRVQLVDLHTRGIRASRVLRVEQAAPSADAYGGVVAINQALGQLLDELTAFVGAASR